MKSWVIEAHVEGQAKGNEKQDSQHNHPTEADKNVDQHDHIGSKQ